MKFRDKSFFIDILNKVKEKMLYPLKLIPILKSNITIISIDKLIHNNIIINCLL